MIAKDIVPLVLLLIDPRSWLLAWRTCRDFSQDPSWNPLRLTKAMLNTLKGESFRRHRGRLVISSFLPPFPSRAAWSLSRGSTTPRTAFRDQAHALRNGPISLFLSLTSRCGLNCRHCSETRNGGGRELDTATWKRIIAGAQDAGCALIGFTGGEPLLRKDLAELVGAVDSRSVSMVFTSGWGADEACLGALARAGLWALGTSLDDPDPQRHDDGRGRTGSHRQALETTRLARKLGLYSMVQTVVNPATLDLPWMRAMVRCALSAGAHEIRFLEPIPAGRLLGESVAPGFDPDDRRRLIAWQRHLQRQYAIKITTFAHTESASQFGCGAGSQHSYINSGGQLFPCDFVPLSHGDCTTEDFGTLWRAMNRRLGRPGTLCMACRMRQVIASEPSLPVAPDRVASLPGLCADGPWPDFYRILQGKHPLSGRSGPA